MLDSCVYVCVCVCTYVYVGISGWVGVSADGCSSLCTQQACAIVLLPGIVQFVADGQSCILGLNN